MQECKNPHNEDRPYTAKINWRVAIYVWSFGFLCNDAFIAGDKCAMGTGTALLMEMTVTIRFFGLGCI